MLTTPPIGKSTGINSAKVDIVRKKINTHHILGDKGKEGAKYIKRVIANVVITTI